MNQANYCQECRETLTLHADGTITCSCEMLTPEQTKIPRSWQLTKEELQEARDREATWS